MGDDVSFDWDADNINHLARHAVTAGEAEQAILDPAAVIVEMREHGSEERIQLVGIPLVDVS